MLRFTENWWSCELKYTEKARKGGPQGRTYMYIPKNTSNVSVPPDGHA